MNLASTSLGNPWWTAEWTKLVSLTVSVACSGPTCYFGGAQHLQGQGSRADDRSCSTGGNIITTIIKNSGSPHI